MRVPSPSRNRPATGPARSARLAQSRPTGRQYLRGDCETDREALQEGAERRNRDHPKGSATCFSLAGQPIGRQPSRMRRLDMKLWPTRF
jgi:hypothetical protein